MASRVRSNRVCFTINNYDCDMPERILKYVESNQKIKFFTCGQEIGDSGTPHLQGFIHIEQDPKKCGLKFWKNELPGGQTAHFENARGTDEQNQEYCQKDGPYYQLGEPAQATCVWSNIIETAKRSVDEALSLEPELGLKYYNQLKAIHDEYNKPTMSCTLPVLRDWQEVALQKLRQQNDRRILFVVDEDGGKGKSALAKHIFTELKAWACQGGKINDLMYAFDTTAEYVVFDMARCNNPDYYPWNFMENLKNGWFTSTKYKGGMRTFPPPKIVVFMNEQPPKNKLSGDRYEIYNI